MANRGELRKGRARWALAIATGLLLTVAYPPFEVAAVAWIGLAPLLVALEGATPGEAFALGWLAGATGSLIVVGPWVFEAARGYFGLGPIAAAGFAVAVTQVFGGVYFGLFAVVGAVLRAGRWRFLVLPAAFVAIEYARAHVLSGCPWELLGHSQRAARVIQLCDTTGVYGLSFLLALASAAIAELRHRRTPALVAAAAALLTLAYGEWRLTAAPTGESVPVLLVQCNLPNQERGRPEFFSVHLRRYLDLTRTGAPLPGTLVVWPENAIGFFPSENRPLLAQITDQLRAEGVALLTGAPRAGDRPGVAALYNSAYLLTADGIAATYDKRKLLPFVERLPFRPGDSPYLAGQVPTVFELDGTRFGVLICYEAIYPELARDLVARGARFLVNISNDSWFEAGAGPEQHYAISRFRAVENHVSLIRVTNGGVSGAVDPWGREIIRLPRGQPLAQPLTVPIGPAGSFYGRHGDLFAALCVIVTLAAGVVRLLTPAR